jgi:hypothetical protein
MSGLPLPGLSNFIVVVGNPNLRRRIVFQDLSAVASQVEVNLVATRLGGLAGGHEQVTEVGEYCSNKMERVFKVVV